MLAASPLGHYSVRRRRNLSTGYDLKEARWLAKDFSFSVTISARHFLATHRNATTFVTERAYLGIGNPITRDADNAVTSYDHQHGRLKDFPAIPETADEVRAAIQLFRAPLSDALLGDNATEENLRTKPFGSYDVIHFATHGLLKGDVPGLSEAALSLSRIDAKDSFNDGILSASEISRFSLRARLIVLSACNSARISTSVAGQSINDLQAAFSIAGTPALLATLWSVETNTAHELMTKFFTEWQKGSSQSASEVLASAVRDYLKQADRSHQHPRFWAPFVVLGYGGALTKVEPAKPSYINDNFQVLPNSVSGELFDAKPLEGNAILSMISDWNGSKCAGTIASVDDSGATVWKTSSYEIGAGAIAINGDSIFAAGYRYEKSQRRW